VEGVLTEQDSGCRFNRDSIKAGRHPPEREDRDRTIRLLELL